VTLTALTFTTKREERERGREMGGGGNEEKQQGKDFLLHINPWLQNHQHSGHTVWKENQESARCILVEIKIALWRFFALFFSLFF
jgi:hypothetical protein